MSITNQPMTLQELNEQLARLIQLNEIIEFNAAIGKPLPQHLQQERVAQLIDINLIREGLGLPRTG